MKLPFYFIIVIFLTLLGCDGNKTATDLSTGVYVSFEQLIDDIKLLSSDEFEGRKTGTEGKRMARDLITTRFEELGLESVGDGYWQKFDFTNARNGVEFTDAVNIIGLVRGELHPDRYIIVSAHYDHLGVRDGEIYNGADDNASGTAGLLAAARWFSENRPKNSILFIAFDAEEQGLAGARHFVNQPLVPLDAIRINVNMDMISLNHDNILYAAGTYHYPFLRPIIEEAIRDAEVTVLFGHDSPDLPPGEDWTNSSDHGAFHSVGIPFVYFGVEDHPHYHTPNDVFENITPEFFYNSTRTILRVISHLDQQLDQLP